MVKSVVHPVGSFLLLSQLNCSQWFCSDQSKENEMTSLQVGSQKFQTWNLSKPASLKGYSEEVPHLFFGSLWEPRIRPRNHLDLWLFIINIQNLEFTHLLLTTSEWRFWRSYLHNCFKDRKEFQPLNTYGLDQLVVWCHPSVLKTWQSKWSQNGDINTKAKISTAASSLEPHAHCTHKISEKAAQPLMCVLLEVAVYNI